MSSSSSVSSTAAISTLTQQELSRLLLAPHMNSPIARTFEHHPTSTAILRYYSFLSQSIVTLEDELERHQLEREQIFNSLMNSKTFRRRILPLVTNFRPTEPRRTRFHPHGYTSPSPSPVSESSPTSGLNRSVESPPSIKPEEALARTSTPFMMDSTGSYHNPIDSSGSTNIDEEPGSQKNPIIIRDDKDECSRCQQQGHQFKDCGTPMRSFQHCEICAWTKQKTCDHIDVPPAWLRELKANIDKKNN
jgi:hypothetical protein